MAAPTVVIGWDSADPDLLQAWLNDGHLPNLSALIARGSQRRLKNTVPYLDKEVETSLTELLWAEVWSGYRASQTGFWGVENFAPENYGMLFDERRNVFDYERYRPFYSVLKDSHVITFDLPLGKIDTRSPHTQILGWGGHFPFTESRSHPPERLDAIKQRYGENPVFLRDGGFYWDLDYMREMDNAISRSIALRGDILCDMLNEDAPDLLVTVFGEAHSSEHLFWHLDQPSHPCHDTYKTAFETSPMLRHFQELDATLGRIVDVAGADANIMVFSPHGMNLNNTDMLSMVLLPEALFRYSFPGKTALARGELGKPLPAPVTQLEGGSWASHLRKMATPPSFLQKVCNKAARMSGLFRETHALLSPAELRAQGSNLAWVPASWYQHHWPHMPAFAMPAFSDGHIRLNVKGREASGLVLPAEYDTACADISDFLMTLMDPRTGKPAVEAVYRTREHAMDSGPSVPDSDLVVIWQHRVIDVLESPRTGRIGPIPTYRTGGHNRTDGFVAACGPAWSAPLPENLAAVDIGELTLAAMGHQRTRQQSA